MQINKIIFSEEITLWWDKEWEKADGIIYSASLNGGAPLTTQKTHISFKDLAPDTDYEIVLARQNEEDGWDIVDTLGVHTPRAKRRIDVTEAPYFAANDGKTPVTEVLQRALDALAEDECLYFPRGTYLSGALNVHSNTEIYLDEGATLQGSEKVEDYLPWRRTRYEGIEMDSYSALLNMGTLDNTAGPNCENIVIRGKGAILGGGVALCDATIAAEKARIEALTAENGSYIEPSQHGESHPWRVRSRLINLSNCAHVVIAGLTLGYAACWNVHFTYSTDIVTYGCKIKSRGVWNGDGWNPDSSTNCTVFDCFFDTHDNSIAVKSGKNPEGNKIGRPAKNIRVFDCAGGRCMALGSEMSGGVEDIYVWDCDFSHSESGFGVKVTHKRGGYVRNCRIRNCRFTKIGMRCVPFNDDGESADHMTRVHDLHFENIRLTGTAIEIENNDNRKPCEALLISGLEGEENHFDRITFDGVLFEKRCDGEAQTVKIKNVKNLRFDRVSYEE